MKKYLKSAFGFTLIEAVVVLGITAILSGVMLVYSRRSESQILLNLEKAKIAQNVLRTKELALTGFTKPVSMPAPCSYGFHIDYNSSVYSLFEYTPAGGCDSANMLNPIDPPSAVIYRETASGTLAHGISFGAGADRLGYIIFVPPDPNIFVFDTNGNYFSNSMKIYLTTQDGSLRTSISVNNVSGQLSF